MVGAGGLGAPLGLYLAAAGVGRIGIVDFDVVDFTNLQRQVIHGTKDVGRKKLDSAADSMLDINPYMQMDKFDTAITSENALDIISEYDMVVDGTDNFPTRYLINDACVLLKKPNVYGSIFRFEGQATVFAYPGGAVLSLLLSRAAASRSGSELRGRRSARNSSGHHWTRAGDRGREAHARHRGASHWAADAVRCSRDAFSRMKVRRNPECPVCGDHPTIKELIDYHQFCGVPNPKEIETVSAPQPGYVSDTEIDAVALKAKLDSGEKFQFIDVREPHEYQIAKIPGAKLIPLNDVPKRIGELDPEAETVVHCKMGGRSAKAADFLRSQGFKHVKNMLGGITAWSDKVDPSVPKY